MIRSRGGVLAAIAVAVAGCGSGEGAKATEAAERFEESGVTVSLTVHIGPDRDGQVAATFTPSRPGFHMYSIDLPPDGVQGVGRPTQVAVSGGLTATGKQHTDQPVRSLRVTGLDVDLPVYPDGPVTVTLPVRRSAGSSSVLVSYAACSASEGCLLPVIDKAIHIT